LARIAVGALVSVAAPYAKRANLWTLVRGTAVAVVVEVRFFVAVMVSWCVACESSGDPVTRGRADREAPGENCPEGGLAIHSGLDSDDDHELDDDEIAVTTYVCNFDKTLQCDEGSVLDGVIELATSEDAERVDGVTCIDGDLVIANNDTLEILGLSRLEMVTGHVVVAGNPQLATLDGLDRLTSVGGTYLLQGNDLLADLSPLATLARGDLAIVANEYMPGLAGLAEMTRAPGSIVIAGNPELASLDGLAHLASSAYPITIRSNRALAAVAFAELQRAGALTIADNGVSKIALPALAMVDGQIAISNEGTLQTLALPGLVGAGSVRIEENRVLADVELSALRELGGLVIEDNRALARLAAPQLSASERVELTDLPSLKSVDLSRIEVVEEKLLLDNVALGSLAGFAALQYAHDVTIASCQALVDFAGLGLVDVGGSFTAKGNTALTAITGLEKLEHVGGRFTFESTFETVREQARALTARIAIGGTITIGGE
jgi:hypothetical protein